MAKCDRCDDYENMPYRCRYCGGTFCGDHRLPENHDCPGLDEWEDPGGVFDSGFDDSVATGGSTGSVADRIGLDTGPGGVWGYFRGNLTYTFLALMWVTWFVQWAVAPLVGLQPNSPAWYAIFTISEANPFYVWTWVTSIFAHAGPGRIMHIVGNSIVIFFFGRLVERYVGSRNFALLFLVSGVLAGLGQLVVFELTAGPTGYALGASGAGLAIMGVLTVLNPNLRVYLYFLLPVPIWVITGFYAIASFVGIIAPAGGGVANGAHLVGLVIGLAYGEYVSRKGVSGPERLEFGGGGRGPRRPGGPGGRF